VAIPFSYVIAKLMFFQLKQSPRFLSLPAAFLQRHGNPLSYVIAKLVFFQLKQSPFFLSLRESFLQWCGNLPLQQSDCHAPGTTAGARSDKNRVYSDHLSLRTAFFSVAAIPFFYVIAKLMFFQLKQSPRFLSLPAAFLQRHGNPLFSYVIAKLMFFQLKQSPRFLSLPAAFLQRHGNPLYLCHCEADVFSAEAIPSFFVIANRFFQRRGNPLFSYVIAKLMFFQLKQSPRFLSLRAAFFQRCGNPLYLCHCEAGVFSAEAIFFFVIASCIFTVVWQSTTSTIKLPRPRDCCGGSQ